MTQAEIRHNPARARITAQDGLTAAQRKAIRDYPMALFRKQGFTSRRQVEKRVLELQRTQSRSPFAARGQMLGTELGRPSHWTKDTEGKWVRKVKPHKVRVQVRPERGIKKPPAQWYAFMGGVPGDSPFHRMYFRVKARYIDEATARALARVRKKFGRKAHLTLLQPGGRS